MIPILYIFLFIILNWVLGGIRGINIVVYLLLFWIGKIWNIFGIVK